MLNRKHIELLYCTRLRVNIASNYSYAPQRNSTTKSTVFNAVQEAKRCITDTSYHVTWMLFSKLVLTLGGSNAKP